MDATKITKEELYKDDYYELKEAQEYLEISKLKLRTFIHEGEIKVYLLETRCNKRPKYFFKKEDLVEFKLLLIIDNFYSKKKCA